jgi:hypothetical protein
VRPERARQPGPAEFRLDLWSRHFAASQRRAASNRWAAGHGHNPGKRRLRPFPELFVSAPGYRQPRIAERRGRCRWTPGLRSRTDPVTRFGRVAQMPDPYNWLASL